MRQIRVLARLVQFEHTIFALPFAYTGAVLAADGFPGWTTLLWITVAMAAARTCAFALNRLIDREIDARNPRTAARPSVTGEVSVTAMAALALGCGAVLFLAAARLNSLCVLLAPIPLAIFVIYPYTKRVTWFAHAVLGLAIGGAPVGGWLAVSGSWQVPATLLGFCVLFWMAGLDILYALQDLEHDRANGLHSVPERFGVVRSLLISDAAHVLAAVFLVAAGIAADVRWPFFVAAVVAMALLVYEHRLVRPTDLSRINRAFFTVNSYFAVVVFAGALGTVALP